MLATIMQALDTTIANVALPHMQGSMSATQDQISWVLTSYIVAAAIMTPPTGMLARRFGRKRLFAVAVVGFTIASMLCGTATSLPEIVVFRLLQGVFGAALVPLSQAVLLDTYPREKHGSAMAMWGMGVMVGPILGPTLGGYLTEYYSWRWVFYINVPFGILALLGILAFVPETESERDGRFDFFGFALLSLAIGALQMMLDRGKSLDWFGSTEIVVEAVAAGLALLHVPGPHVHGGASRSSSRRCSRTAISRPGLRLCSSSASCCWRRSRCCRRSCRTCWAIRCSPPGSCWRRAASARCSR